MPAKPATTASSTIAYHSCRRQRIDLSIDDVPHAAPRLDHVAAELLAEVGDVDLDEVGERVVVLVEDVFVDARARDHLAAAQGEVFEDGVFAGGQDDVLGTSPRRALAGV